MDSFDNDYDRLITTQAIIELTEANVSANGYSDEWTEQVTFLQDSAEECSCSPDSIEIREAIALASALG